MLLFIAQVYFLPINSNAQLTAKEAFALWITLNIVVFLCMLIRFVWLCGKPEFKRQTPLRNFFYELQENDSERWKVPTTFNIYFVFFLIFNSGAAFIILWLFITNLL